MMDNRVHSFDMYCRLIKEFAACMDNYLYVYDIKQDIYYISELAQERFSIQRNPFSHVEEVLRTIVHEDDYDWLMADLHKITAGEEDLHDMNYRWIGKDGETIWINCHGRSIRDTDGTPIFLIGCVNEIGRRQIADNVSGLLGESAFQHAFERLPKCPPDSGYILRLGIDNFRVINEKFGSKYGDQILRDIADSIRSCLTEGQSAFRLVGDEFLIVDPTGPEDGAVTLYQSICRKVDDLIAANHYEAMYTLSGGILTPEHFRTADYTTMMKLSQFTLGQAKTLGKNQVYSFNAEDYERFLRKRKILRELRQAVNNNYEGFQLNFQPIVNAKTEQMYAAETLLRFRLSDGENISPGEFIPILEESALIIPVGKWVLRSACELCHYFQQIIPNLKISVNLSYVQLLKSPVYRDVMDAIQDARIQPSSLIVELTESGYLENNNAILNVWNQLKEQGVLIAVDDFGTGYSNFQYINALKPDILKIDRTFTVSAMRSKEQLELMRHLLDLVRTLGLQACVEGIETQDELEQISKLLPDLFQGFYYSKPCPVTEFEKKYLSA